MVKTVSIGWISFLLLSAGQSQGWELVTGASSWAPRSGHTSLVFNDDMWVIGGFYWSDGPNFRNDVWRSTDGADWTLATEAAPWSGRMGHTSVVFDGRMWVLGGFNLDGSNSEVWSSSDGITWASVTLEAPWSGRSGHTSVVHDGKIWVLGGGAGTSKSDVWSSSDGIAWVSATLEAPWSPRSRHSSVVHDGRIWVLGGGDTPDPSIPDGMVFFQDVWHSADGVTWASATMVAPWPTRANHTSVVYGQKMCLLGGDRIVFGPAVWYNDVWYSSDGVNWMETEDHADWSARGGHTSVVYDGRIWVLGGEGETAWATSVWRSSSLANQSADLNNDGAVDFLDLLLLLHEWKWNISD